MLDDQIIVRATVDDVAHFANRRWPDEPSRALYSYLAESAPNGAAVAKDVDGARLGVAIGHACEDEWYLSDLFVEPGVRGNGIGRALMAAATVDRGDALRSALSPAADFSAVAVLAGESMAMRAPVFRMTGSVPREDTLLRMAAGDYRFETHPLDPRRDASAIAALDRDVRGCARPVDHGYLSESATGVAFALRDEFVGYAYVSPDGRVGPLATASAAYSVQFLAYAFVALGRSHGATWSSLLVPGPNVRLMRASLRAGLAIADIRVFCAEGATADLSRYAGYHDLLF